MLVSNRTLFKSVDTNSLISKSLVIILVYTCSSLLRTLLLFGMYITIINYYTTMEYITKE